MIACPGAHAWTTQNKKEKPTSHPAPTSFITSLLYRYHRCNVVCSESTTWSTWLLADLQIWVIYHQPRGRWWAFNKLQLVEVINICLNTKKNSMVSILVRIVGTFNIVTNIPPAPDTIGFHLRGRH